MTNRAYRAIEFIGDDLIERAQMIGIAKPQSRIWTKGIAIAASLILIVGGTCYVGIWYWDDNQDMVGSDLGDNKLGTSERQPLVTTDNKFPITESGPLVTETKPPITIESTPGEVSGGFHVPAGEPLPSDFAAFRSDISKFKIGNVSLTFYFGGVFYENIEWTQSIRDIREVELYFINDEGTEYFIRQTNDRYISEEYRCRLIEKEDGTTEIEFNHSEVLTIPQELFTNSNGFVEFRVVGENLLSEFNKGKRTIAGFMIFYSVEDGYVTLS